MYVLLFQYIVEIEDFDFNNILLDEKSYENILLYDILYKTLIGAKLLRIIFNKADGFIRDYIGTKYLILFGSEKFDAIFDRNRHLIRLKRIFHMIFLIIMQKLELILTVIHP